ELDYSTYRKQITYANVSVLVSATSGITFPLVDWVYNLQKGDNKWQTSKIFLKDAIYPFSSISYPTYYSLNLIKSYTEFYPCFFLSSLVSEIFQQNGLKTSGTLFSDPIFNRLLITPYQG